MASGLTLETLGATIVALIDKGDASIKKGAEFYQAAGLHLIEAKATVKALSPLPTASA